MLNRKVSVTKRPSTTKVRSRPSNLSHGFGDAPTPKTRFSLRSCSSPRLKSFPAEQIKKLDPLENPQGNVDTACRIRNGGQGDNIQTQQQQPDPSVAAESFPSCKPGHHRVSSERQVSRVVYPVNGPANQSELVIPSTVAASAVNERPHPHRPHVPHATATPRDTAVSPGKPPCPHQAKPQTAARPAEASCIADEGDARQHRDPWSVEGDSIKPNPEKDSADRYPGFFRRNVATIRKDNVSAGFPQGPGPDVSNLCPVAEEKPPESSQQPRLICQGHQPTLPSCYHNEDTLRRHHADVATNQQLNYYGPIGSHPGYRWIQSNETQSQSGAVNIATQGNFDPESHQHPGRNGIQAPNQHHVTQGNCQAQQCYHPRYQVPNQTPPNLETLAKTPDDGQQKGRALRFTAAMMKDQETLLTAMRQQGIPEDIMRRQFDALLAEQRQQLSCFEQLERAQTDDGKLAAVPQARRVQRKISKIEEDGKPEWMLHITPPRIPYSVMEKMRSEANSQQPQSAGNYAEDRQLCRQVTQENCGQTWQSGGPNDRQQPGPPSCNCANAVVKGQHQICSGNSGVQSQMVYHGYPVQQHPQHQICSGNQGLQPQIKYHGYPVQQNPQHQICSGNSGVQPQMEYHGYPVQQNPQHRICSGNPGVRPQMEYHEYPTQQHPQHQQQIPQESRQSGANDVRVENNQTQQQQQQQASKALEPSSLLKLRLYKEVIRQQKQNNGLQDPETVREALEALKNPANRKGLEYLDVLNAKREKPVSLNGAQDPQVGGYATNGSSPLWQPAKMPSANGLENHRNPNNEPSPSSILLRKKIQQERQWPEYPRQRIKSDARNCYSFVAERENGTVANGTTSRNCSTLDPTWTGRPMPLGSENAGQSNRVMCHCDEKPLSSLSRSIPLATAENQHQGNQHRCCTGQMRQFNGNPNQTGATNNQLCSQPHFAGSNHVGPGNEQQYRNANTEIQELIMPGGLKYFARKPEYIPHPSIPHHCGVNPGKYFYPTVPCQ